LMESIMAIDDLLCRPNQGPLCGQTIDPKATNRY
jgi:hypothetical protein